MNKIIDLDTSIKQLSEEYPEVIEIMKELGFERITNPMMLNTAGRVMTLRKGSVMQNIPLEKIRETFIAHGFTIRNKE